MVDSFVFLCVVAVCSHCSVMFYCAFTTVYPFQCDGHLGCFRVWVSINSEYFMVQEVDILRPKLEDLALLQKIVFWSVSLWMEGASHFEVPGRRKGRGGRERVEVLWS